MYDRRKSLPKIDARLSELVELRNKATDVVRLIELDALIETWLNFRLLQVELAEKEMK